MKNQLYYFDVYPRVLPAHKRSEVHIRPLSCHVAYEDDKIYYVHVIPTNERTRNVYKPEYPVLQVKPQNGEIVFSYDFGAEQMYVIWVADKEVTDNLYPAWEGVRRDELSVYVLEEDLLGLRPLRGNMHIHSCRSDGSEAPEMVVAQYRGAGYDYAALTDHGKFEPSVEAIDAFKGAPIDMAILTGEEVHSPDNLIHIINFAGDYSVNNLYREDEPAYRAAVEEILKIIEVPEGVNAYEVAACKWVFAQIEKAHGLSILCHPNWTWYGAYNIPYRMYEYWLGQKDYDVLELINGGNHPHENQLQVSTWMNANPRPIVVGTDDSHGSVNGEWFDIGKTYVLAPSLQRDDVVTAMQKGLCCAVEQYHGQVSRIYGSDRLVRYFTWLEQEYFPIHDEMCREEGRLMLQYRAGDPTAVRHLQACEGQTLRLWQHLIGK